MKTKELVLSAECLVLSAKKMLAVALCAVGLAAFAEPQKIGDSDVTWELTEGNTVLTIGGTGAMPDFEEGAAPWYSERETITAVKIGSGVTRIGSYAFYACQTMASVTIPSSVTSTGVRAFGSCTGVAELRIDSIESWCKVSIETGDAVGGPFAASTVSEKKLYVGGADVPTTALVIPDGIKTVNDCAFVRFDMLTSVTIPSSVTSIGNEAFYSCSGLTSVTIPSSVTNIGYSAFCECSGLTSVTIPSSVTSIGDNAFWSCSGLTRVTMLEGLPSIARAMFLHCNNLTSVTIPASVTNIGDQAFCECSGLTSVTIPSSVTSIGKSAFDGCSGLTRVTIPSSVENIGQLAFSECTGLTSVTIPSSVTNIGNNAFSSCSALKYVVEMREQPPTANLRIFGFPQTFKGTIYVSPTSVETYKATGGWNTYKDFIKSWLPTVEYLDWDDEKKEMYSVTCMAYDVVTNGMDVFEAGRTYMVTNDVVCTKNITVEGTEANPTRLILCDGTKLTVQGATEKAGLTVASGSVLVICGQKDGTGTLEATGGYYGAGIGGDNSVAGGTVTINGGAVTANGGDSAAGIGGGAARSGGTVTINGGTVTTTGGYPAAGIGGGMGSISGGTVTFGGTGFSVVTGKTATVAVPVTQDDYAADHKAVYAFIKAPIPGSKDNPWKIGKNADDTVAAYIDESGKLIIEGKGAMKAFNGETDPAPWGDTITEVEIGEDVTSIGANAFNGSTALTDVTLKTTQPPVVGMNAFKGCDALEAINVPLWSSGAYKHADTWSDYADGIVEPEQPKIWADGYRIAADKQVGVCSWTWHGDMETVLKEMQADGRYNGMQLALAPWLGIDSMSLYFGDKESSEMWNFIKGKIWDGELNVMATMINFPKEDYTTLSSITNTMGYMYGEAEKWADAEEQWKTNLYFTAEAARLSKELGVDTLSTEAGFIIVNETLMFERMKEVCMTCAVHGVQLLIESGPQNSLQLTNLLINLEKEGFTNVGINFDPGDTELFGSESPVDSYKIMKPWIRMVHVKDCHENDRTKEGWNEDCVWGDGIVSLMDFHDNKADPRHFLEQLTAEGYAGDILYERLSGDPTLTPERKEEITLAMDRIFDALPAPIAAESDEFTVDLRTSIALASGETTVSNVTWSATAWSDESGSRSTDIGFTNLTTRKSGTLATALTGEGAMDIQLPAKDGTYTLTHTAGDLASFVTFTVSGYPVGSGPDNPWEVGPEDDPDATVAWKAAGDNQNVYFKPPRSAVSRAGLETITNAMGGTVFDMWLIAADGSATNGVQMIVGASGAQYTLLDEIFASKDDTFTLYDVSGYFVSYSGGEGALGEMESDTFLPSVPTNLTANAYQIVGYEFAGWSTDGVTLAYTNCHAGVDFVQPGETLSLTALWTQAETVPTSYADLTNKIAQATLPVTLTLDSDIVIPAGGKIVVPAGKDVTFNGIGKFDVTAERPALFRGYPVGTGLKPEDLGRFVTDKDVKAYYEDGKVVVRGRGEKEEFPWLIGTAGHEDEVTAWAGDEMILTKPTRGTASVAALQSVTNALSGYVPGLGELKVISADGTATNNVVMLLGSDGVPYNTLADVLAANPRPETVRLFEVKGCVVTYDGMGHSGTMASDTFLPGIPTNLTANAYTAFGYMFQGWTTNGDTKVVFKDKAAIDDPQPGDIYDLKAVWKLTPVTVGKGVTAYLDENGVLHIKGKGAMKDFTDKDPAPWAEFAPDIKAIEVAEGVTKLGNAAFEALDYKATTTALTFQDEDHVLNLLAFVSADGSKTNAPVATAFSVYKDSSGTVEPIEAFQTLDMVYVYGKAPALMRYGYDEVLLLTLPDLKAVQTAELIETAGELPYSKTMQGILDEALDKIDKATNFNEVMDGYAKRLAQIEAQAVKDKTNEIEGSKITWRVMDGTLYINGEGEMPDFVAPDFPDGAPWNEMKDDIMNATVAAGIAPIGDAAFAVCPAFAESVVLFKDPEATINLGAFVSGDGSATNVPTVKVEIVTVDEKGEHKLRVVPGGWTDADDPNVTYDSLAEAIEDGATTVKAAFEKETDEGEKAVPPAEVEEVVKTVSDPDDPEKEIELTAKYENVPTAEGATDGLVTEVENLRFIVDNTGSNITVVVTATNKMDVAEKVVEEMDGAMSNDCENVKADLGVESVATVGFDSSYLDMSAFSQLGNYPREAVVEFAQSVIAHIPMKLYDGQIYSVSRRHQYGTKWVTEVLPMWYEGIDADEKTAATNEWVKVDVANQELVVKTRRFCDYALGTLELEKSCTVFVGDSGKELGTADPKFLATNFQIRVTGALNTSDFAGYAKRAKGESAGDYAINFVCTKMPKDYDGPFVVEPGTFTIEPAEMIAANGTVTYPKAQKNGYLQQKKAAAWKAKAKTGCVFAGWVAADGAPACVTTNLEKFSWNELRDPKLSFTVAKGERIAPKDIAATWAHIDEDKIAGIAVVTNSVGAPTKLVVDTLSHVTASAKGLPAGLKLSSKTLKFSGKPTKNGTFKVTVSVKNASGYTAKQTFRIKVSGKKVTSVVPADDFTMKGVSVMIWCDAAMGSTTGTGVYALPKKLKIKATPKKGYEFAGWYWDPGFSEPVTTFAKGKDYRGKEQSLVLTGPTYLFARFVEKTTKADPIVWLRYAGAGYCGADASVFAEDETWYQGVKLPTNACQIAFGSLTWSTVKVTGLPKGVTFDAKTLSFKGVPTKTGKFTVKVSVSNRCGSTDVLKVPVTVVALPTWTVGNFDGYHIEDGATNGTFTATVGSTGKVSGKTAGGLAATTFSAKSFSNAFTLDGSNLIYAVDVTVKYKVGKKTYKQTDTLYLMADPLTGLGTIGGGDRDGCGSVGVQRAWDRKDLADVYPAFDTKADALKGVKVADGLTLKFGAKGKVTVGGKVDGVKASGTTYVMPVLWTDEGMTNLVAQVPVYVAKAGFCAVYDVQLTVGEGGKFNAVSPSPSYNAINAPIFMPQNIEE